MDQYLCRSLAHIAQREHINDLDIHAYVVYYRCRVDTTPLRLSTLRHTLTTKFKVSDRHKYGAGKPAVTKYSVDFSCRGCALAAIVLWKL